MEIWWTILFSYYIEAKMNTFNGSLIWMHKSPLIMGSNIQEENYAETILEPWFLDGATKNIHNDLTCFYMHNMLI